MLYRNTYDLLITDNEMPKVSGIELLRKLHARQMVLPVVSTEFLLWQSSGGHDHGLRPKAILIKPYTFKELLGTVKEVLLTTIGYREEMPIALWKNHRPGFVCCND